MSEHKQTVTCVQCHYDYKIPADLPDDRRVRCPNACCLQLQTIGAMRGDVRSCDCHKHCNKD